MIRARLLTAALALTALGACEKLPTEPFDGVKKLEISGPSTAAPGQTLRYVATATYADGSTRDVTADATWRSMTAPVSFTSAGVAAVRSSGEGTLEATFHIFKAQVHLLVLEPGTFKLSGTLRERGGSSLPFGGKIVVLSGVGQGKQAIGSTYNIYGVAGPIRLEASSQGYFSAAYDLDVTGHAVHDVELVPLETPVDIAGDWTLTLGPPPPGCPAGLPAAAEIRFYNMALIQKGTKLQLQIRGPTLQVADDSYTGGTISGQRVTLSFLNPEDDFGVDIANNLIDKLSATETLSFKGQLVFQGNESSIATTMDGTVRYWSRPVTQPPSWECKTANYPVTLRR